MTNLTNLFSAYEEDNSTANFWAIYKARKDSIKLTAPQQEIINSLKGGSVIVVLNPHHSSGGQWTLNGELGGTIYKPFWNALDKIFAGSGISFAPKGFILYKSEFDLIDEVETCMVSKNKHSITVEGIRYTCAHGRVMAHTETERIVLGSAWTIPEFVSEIRKHRISK